MHYTYYPEDVCSSKIDLDIEEGVVCNLKYTGGCDGNAKALGALAEGMTATELIGRLSGITCGHNATSCADQLARCLMKEIIHQNI